MLAQAVVEIFKYKVVSSIIVLACWPPADQIKFTRQLTQYGMTATFSCDAAILDQIRHQYLQGVLYITHEHDDMIMFKKVKKNHFMMKYKWLIVGDHVPDVLRKTRYDSDIVFLKWEHGASNETRNSAVISADKRTSFYIDDAYVHPRDGITTHLWAHWTNVSGLVLTHDRERILRRRDLKKYPLRIATPLGHYSSDKYNGTFVDFLEDESMSDQDPGIRSGYGAAMLLTEVVNAQDVLIENELWSTMINNNSMYVMVSTGEADISGAILRILWDRTFTLDYVMPIWPFRVGFTYLAERESSSNMYLEPFSPAVWWSCLAMMTILALVEWMTSKTPQEKDGALYTAHLISADKRTSFYIDDAYVHPRDGITTHLWAHWTNVSGLVLTHDRERILRRRDLKKYPLRIATPLGHYSSDKYNGTFVDFLEDESMSDQDPGIRSGYGAAMLLTEVVNAQDVLIENELWSTMINNNSMYVMVSTGEADISGAILRILWDRTFTLDYVMPIWPFRVGFTYLAERESSSNMYLEPFSPAVWWSCLAMMTILALVEWMTSKTPQEKDGALYTVLSTWLQQDASAVPEGISGRWAFTVMSVSAMLVHAYYTSAIVSALMSTGRGGPDSLKALGDSKYAIASEDYDYMRYLFFDVKTTWDELEYLKKKKMSSSFYQELERGVELIEQGSTAFHSEYNQIYPHFKTFSDEHICKLQHVDTIPETLTWITSTKDGQWTEVLRTAGAWLHETGLGKRLVARLRVPQPPCRASLLAERVKLGDIAPLLALTGFGAFLSMVLLGVEILFEKAKRGRVRVCDAKSSIDNIDVSEAVE